MTTFHLGCAGFPCPRERYLARLSLVELDLAPPAPVPRTLTKWKQTTPEGFVHSVVAPPAFWGDRSWPLRDPEAARVELERVTTVAGQLGAGAVVFRSPVALSPGSVASQRLRPLLELASKRFARTVWDPQGLWEREDAQRFVEGLNVVIASDPLHDDVAGEAVVYARLRGLGIDRRYHQGRLEELAARLAGAEEAFVVFSSERAWRDACGFAAVVGALSPDLLEDDDEDEEDEEGDEDEDDEDER